MNIANSEKPHPRSCARRRRLASVLRADRSISGAGAKTLAGARESERVTPPGRESPGKPQVLAVAVVVARAAACGSLAKVLALAFAGV